MNPRIEFLRGKLRDYLTRRTMPRGLQDKPDAHKAELSALIDCLLRYAPRQGYDEWWSKLETHLDENADTRAWPTVSEIKKAAISLRGTQSKHIAEADDIDPIKIIGERMSAGEAVGDGYLYGRMALDLEKRGLVSPDVLRKCRSALYFNLKHVYGEEKARTMEAAFLKRHERAEATAKSQASFKAPEYQPKKIPAREYD